MVGDWCDLVECGLCYGVFFFEDGGGVLFLMVLGLWCMCVVVVFFRFCRLFEIVVLLSSECMFRCVLMCF